MTFKNRILLSVFVLLFIDTVGQPNTLLSREPYSVDKQIDLQLKKFQSIDTSTLKNSMTIKVFWNANTFFNQTLDCYTKSYLVKDTIIILGHMASELGWGFRLVLYKDSCIAASFGLSDGNVYKYNRSDADSTNFILLPNISQKVTLSKRPLYQNGDIISGAIEIKSIPYYYTNLDGKFRIELKAYFKTAAIKQSE
jgi:hypothetical protein